MSDRVFISTRKGLFSAERAGKGWRINRVSFLGSNVTLSLFDSRDDTLYAALDHGHFGVKLHRSNDLGETWDEVAAPAYPTRAEGAEEEKDPQGRPWPWSLKLIWSLEIDSRKDGSLWCGTIPGGLFRSADGGSTWTMQRNLWDMPERMEWFGGGMDHPGIHSICVHPDNPDHVALGVSCGGVWLTEDGGARWACRAQGMRAEYMPPEKTDHPNIQDPHHIVQCRAQPAHYWAQHHNGIFKSTDGCASWQEIEGVKPSAFGFAVAVHPEDPKTAWFIPGVKDECRIPVDGKLVVTRTTDGGESFDVLTEGLPQEHAYDLVFRHGLDIDSKGERLAFGSTTGSVWISEDQGDTWQSLCQNLPPVYALRFAP